jgi:hypothetical protein
VEAAGLGPPGAGIFGQTSFADEWRASRRVPNVHVDIKGCSSQGELVDLAFSKGRDRHCPPYIKRHQSLKTSASCLDLRHSSGHTHILSQT